MEPQDLKEALRSMGYRQYLHLTNVYAKSLGYSLLLFTDYTNLEYMCSSLIMNSIDEAENAVTLATRHIPATSDMKVFMEAICTAECSLCHSYIDYRQSRKPLNFAIEPATLDVFSTYKTTGVKHD